MVSGTLGWYTWSLRRPVSLIVDTAGRCLQVQPNNWPRFTCLFSHSSTSSSSSPPHPTHEPICARTLSVAANRHPCHASHPFFHLHHPSHASSHLQTSVLFESDTSYVHIRISYTAAFAHVIATYRTDPAIERHLCLHFTHSESQKKRSNLSPRTRGRVPWVTADHLILEDAVMCIP